MKAGDPVRVSIPAYGHSQKGATRNLSLIPKGELAYIRQIREDRSKGLTYALVRTQGGLWAEISTSVLQEVT